EAIQNYGRALQLKPGEAMFYINLGKALVDQGNLPEAIQNYERALQLKPDFAEAYYNLGNALVGQGKLLDAIQNYERAIQLKPNYVKALTNLAYLLATSEDAQLRNGARAVTLSEQADELTGSKNPVVLATLAAAYAEEGRYPE